MVPVAQDTFRAYCANKPDLDGKSFVKLCKDCEISDQIFTQIDVDLKLGFWEWGLVALGSVFFLRKRVVRFGGFGLVGFFLSRGGEGRWWCVSVGAFSLVWTFDRRP